MLKKISVQICTHNRKALLQRVLETLNHQTFPHEQYEIIVVDDGCTDGTAEMLEKQSRTVDFRWIKQEKLGLAIARNKAIQMARGELILFLDDDVLADSRLIEEHVRAHERHPHSVIKGWVNHVSTFEVPAKPHWTWRDFSTAFFWTSNVSVARESLLEAGLFEEGFREYGWEDLELGLRLKQLGLQSRLHRAAIGYHYKPPVTGKDLPRMLRQAEAKGRTAVFFVQKQLGWRSRLATGIYPFRLFADRIFSHPKVLSFYRRWVPESEVPLRGWRRFCANALVTAHYFASIRKSLRGTVPIFPREGRKSASLE